MKAKISLLLIFWANLVFAQSPFDLLIRQGRIIDGSGNPWFVADIGITNGKIVAIGRLEGLSAARVIEAKGLAVSPGFIDVHAHIEGGILEIPTADNFILDGVTTLVTGNCGSAEADLGKFFEQLQQKQTTPNVASLAGHNAIRRTVMQLAPRTPTPQELAQMEALMAKAMHDGAVGLSTGLIYLPGTFANTDEIVALAKVAAQYGGVYASHIRNESDSVHVAIAEALHIGRAAGIPVEISHLKASGRNNWGRSREMLALIERAREEGIDVNVDQYPYTASSTNLGVLLPSWAMANGDSALRARLADAATRKKIVAEIKRKTEQRGGSKRLDYAYVARYRADSTYNGKNISQITQARTGKKPKLADEIETVLQMMLKGGAQMIYHTMGEEDVERIMQYPFAMIASDGGVNRFGSGVPHPRAYGTNARVLGRYVRERKALKLEDAIRKMTSLPAQRFGLNDRGLLHEGMAADVLIFDPNTVGDQATFNQPHAYSQGFHYIIVNGQVVAEQGKHNGARPGQVLRGKGYQATRNN